MRIPIFCFVSLAACSAFAQLDEPVDQRIVDLVSVFIENAKSIRNYDVTIDKSILLTPTESNSQKVPYLKQTQVRVVLDWDKEHFWWICRETTEDTKVVESLRCLHFANGAECRRDKFSGGKPVVRNSTFLQSLRQSKIPSVELAGLLGYPGSYQIPFEQMQVNVGKNTGGAKTMFRTLPDGTGVRTVETKTGDISVTHFDPRFLMPVYTSLKLESKRNSDVPQTYTKTLYEEIESVFRPKEMTVREHEVTVEEDERLQKRRVIFFDGQGTVSFKWHAFNDPQISLPDDSQFLGADREFWISQLKLD